MSISRITMLFFLTLLSSCATSPSGRSQLLLLPGSQMQQMGVAAFSEMKNKTKLSTRKSTNRYVSCVAEAVASQLPERYQQQWEVVVFDDESANAFALPGGKIGVHSGLLKIADSQDQLASVIGHEIAHVLAQHGNERMSIQFASQTGQQLVGILLEGSEGALGQQKADIMAALGLGSTYLVQLPFSRTHESEADLLGLELMAQAGFDPTASVQLWLNMEKLAKGAPPEFMSTHPSHSTRIDDLQANMSAASEIYTKAQKRGQTPRCGG